MTSAPRSQIRDGELLIDGEPFLILGAELHNSSSSTAHYVADKWEAIGAAGVNTVLASISWAQWEPEEGRFDTAVVDHLLRSAREHDLCLVLLWFGSWKNGVSSYSPTWVKLDPARFPLAHTATGAPVQALSVFSDENRDADARAFAALLRHLRDVDAEHGTVILVQVENEVGLLTTARDYSAPAQQAWDAAPEAGAVDAPSWRLAHTEEDRASELFMAWHYARYIDHVAAAGQHEWPLPMYANAWLDSYADPAAMSGGQRPGEYPSGGPIPRVLHAWKAAAPHLSFFSPDIYTDDVATRSREYIAACGILFLPELKRTAPGELFEAIGANGAIGVSPFGIDSAPERELTVLSRAYRQLAAVGKDILDGRRRGDVRGFALTDRAPDATLTLGDYEFVATRDFDPLGTGEYEDGYGVLIQNADGSFLIAGHGVVLRARHQQLGRPAWVLECRELAIDGTGDVIRELNGDETGGGEIIRITRTDPPGFGPIPIAASVSGLLQFSLYCPNV